MKFFLISHESASILYIEVTNEVSNISSTDPSEILEADKKEVMLEIIFYFISINDSFKHEDVI